MDLQLQCRLPGTTRNRLKKCRSDQLHWKNVWSSAEMCGFLNQTCLFWTTSMEQLIDFVLPLFSLHANSSTCSLVRQMIFQCVTFRKSLNHFFVCDMEEWQKSQSKLENKTFQSMFTSILNAGLFILNCIFENRKQLTTFEPLLSVILVILLPRFLGGGGLKSRAPSNSSDYEEFQFLNSVIISRSHTRT